MNKMVYAEKRLRHMAQTLLFATVIALYACILPMQRMQAPAAPVFSDSIAYQAMTRDETRSMAVETLADLSVNEEISAEQRLDAQHRLSDILERAQQDADIETELDARGFGKSVANVSSGFVSVLLEKEQDAQSIAAIMETVGRITGCAPGDIRLIPLNML